jgi:hypothetical protein
MCGSPPTLAIFNHHFDKGRKCEDETKGNKRKIKKKKGEIEEEEEGTEEREEEKVEKI